MLKPGRVPLDQAPDMSSGSGHVGVAVPGLGQFLRCAGQPGGPGAITVCQRAADKQHCRR